MRLIKHGTKKENDLATILIAISAGFISIAAWIRFVYPAAFTETWPSGVATLFLGVATNLLATIIVVAAMNRRRK